MSFRFRNRIKVLPGIYLNIGKNGVSTTIGPRGATINIGGKGAYLNTSIPGTGISNRQKLFGGNTANPKESIDDKVLPIIEEEKEKTLEDKEEIITSEGLKGLKEHLEECKKERELLLNEILQTKKIFAQLENDFSEKRNTFLNDCKNETELLETKIAETNNSIIDLEHLLYKKQNGTFSKLFTKQETIENIKAEIERQNLLSNDLKIECENTKPLDFSLISSEEFSKLKFLSKLLDKKEEIERVKKEGTEQFEYLNELQIQYANAKANININSEVELSDQYAKVANAFYELKNSNKIWDITSETKSSDLKASAKTTVTRQEVKFCLKDIDFIESTEPAFYLENADGSHFYIYPAFILLMDNNGKFNLLDLKELNFQFIQQRFLEEKISIPSDSKIIDNVWAKVNKDGSPDMRFSGNYQTPVVHYGVLNFKVNDTLSEKYNISNFEASQNFANEFMNYLALLKNETSVPSNSIITKEYFDIAKEFGDKIVSFISKIQKDKQFIDKIYQSKSIRELSFENSNELIRFFFLLDLLKCFSLAADISNLQSKEAFALLYITAKTSGVNIDNYTNLHLLYEPNFLKGYDKVCSLLKSEIEKASSDDAIFKIPLLLSIHDKDLQKEYLSDLYRFASIVVKADGTVTKEEETALKKILSISEQHKSLQVDSEQKPEVEKAKSFAPQSQHSLQEVLEELNSLIGLNAVKQEINSLINFIKIQKAREASGLKSSSLSYHIVFTGNPGTGKTTVARIVSEIYKNLGVLTQGQLVETDRSGLVAEYLGQTAVKVNKIVDSALNGILFIDEAYSLVGENKDDFGKEAVATLIKRMEDNRDKLVVIIAGYTNEMKEFIDTNPGFKSRFNRYIEFNDYIPDELFSIYKLNCSKLEYTLTDEAEKKLSELFTSSFTNRDKFFGNGRFVRNIFEKTLEKQADRIASIPSLTKEILTTITLEDIPISAKS